MDTIKRCVYCGGADHPAECGYTEAELQAMTTIPWARIWKRLTGR